MKREPNWIDKQALLLLHDESLSLFGGARGMRDEGLLDSALSRPVNKFLHESVSDLAEPAAAYAYGIIKNHAFIDGNKRAAFLSLGLFLAINGKRLRAKPLDAIHAILGLAAGELEEAELAKWIQLHMKNR